MWVVSAFGLIENKAAINMSMQGTVQISAFSSFGSLLWSGIPSYLVIVFTFLRNCQIVLHGGCTISPSYQQCVHLPVSLHPRQDLLFSAV